MNDVRRFSIVGNEMGGFECTSDRHGEFVLFKDYAALEEENKRLRMNLKWALVNMEPRCADYEKWDCMLTALEEGGDGV